MWLPKPTDKCIGGRLSPVATWAEVRLCVSDVIQHGLPLSSAPDLRGFTLRCVLHAVHIECSCIKLFVLLDTLINVRNVSIQSGPRESTLTDPSAKHAEKSFISNKRTEKLYYISTAILFVLKNVSFWTFPAARGVTAIT